MTAFRPLHYREGYLPIEDYGLIGDRTTAALVGRDGSISWMCLPRFDSSPLFCRILDAKHGGSFTVSLEGLSESRQFYQGDTRVLVTEMRCPLGLIRLTDAFSLRSGADQSEDVPAGRSELVRSVTVLDGRIDLTIEIEPRGGAHAEAHGEGLRLRCPAHPGVELHLQAKGARPVPQLTNRLNLSSGDRLELILRWGSRLSSHIYIVPEDPLRETIQGWHRWMRRFQYDGPKEPLVRRSAITLKLLDYTPNGAIVAAPTYPTRMVATASTIASGLSAGKGLLYRYLPEESPDGLPGHDGAFLLCSFWLVDNLAHQGRLDEALDLSGSLCARAGSLGLLPEEIDPGSGAFLGNYPQAFSHIGVISSGVNLARLMKKAAAR